MIHPQSLESSIAGQRRLEAEEGKDVPLLIFGYRSNRSTPMSTSVILSILILEQVHPKS